MKLEKRGGDILFHYKREGITKKKARKKREELLLILPRGEKGADLCPLGEKREGRVERTWQ